MKKLKFKNILYDHELENVNIVKEYLTFSLNKRKPKKDFKFYINICKIYNFYPNTICDILDNIPKLGYYKDYFFILFFSRNENLNNYIYKIIINQIKKDVDNFNKKQKIST